MNRQSPRLFVLLLALLFAVLALRPISSPDFWWHLTMGQATWEAASPVYSETLALGTRTQYVNVVWLFDVALWHLFTGGGTVAVGLMVAFLTVASFLLCHRLANNELGGSQPWTALLLATLAMGGTHPRFIARPQAVFLVLLPFIVMLGRRATRPGGGRALVGILVASALWAQVHASVVIAPAVVGAAMLRWRWGQPLRTPQGFLGLGRWHWATLGILAIVPLTGPSGTELVLRVLAHHDNEVVRLISEMQPMRLADWFSLELPILIVETLLLLGLGGALRHRRLPDAGALLLALLGMVLTLSTIRFASAWAILLLPLVASGLGPITPSGESRWRLGAARLAALGVPVVLALGSGAPSFSVATHFPEGASEALRRLDVRGPLFNDYDVGGYLGWALGGRVRVLVDSRSQMHFSNEELMTAIRALEAPQLFTALDRAHGFRAALVPRSAGLCRALDTDTAWSPVWFGEARALFLKAPETEKKLRHLAPCDPNQLGRCRGAATPDAFIDEVEKMLRLAPQEASLGRLGALLAYQCARKPRFEAAADFLEIAAREPEHPDFKWLSALTTVMQGDLERGLKMLEDLPPQHTGGRLLRLRVLRQQDRAKEVAALARENLKRLGKDAPAGLREQLSWACEQEGDHQCAVRQALRAALEGNAAARQRFLRYRASDQVPEDLKILARGVLD
jgi:hypothetical protein